METYYTTNMLVSLTSRGNKKFWIGYAVTDGGNYYSRTEYWQELANGLESEHTLSAPKIATIKNEGRSNEVQPREQAVLEIESAYERKRDSGYVSEGESLVPVRPLPMLAHPFEKRKHNIKYPAFVQPKLDGTRMLFDGSVGWSRKGKDYIDEVIEHLKFDCDIDVILDGELMLNQDRFTFQETISAIKKFDPKRTPYLQFHVYDLINPENPDMSFDERYDLLNGLVGHIDNPSIILVDTREITKETDVNDIHGEYVSRGYEGVIIRNMDGLYKDGKRSADLQKFKHFEDNEFIVVDVVDGVGKEEGCAVFICETADGNTFNVRPKGTTEQRQLWYVNRHTLVGNLLTVKYQELTDGGIPRFPVGLTLRDYE